MDKHRNKTGGRQKGTPNKTTASLKEWIASVIDGQRDQFVKDLAKLTPFERVKIVAGLLPFITPKQQSVEMDAQVKHDAELISRSLADAPDEYIELIADKVAGDEQDEAV